MVAHVQYDGVNTTGFYPVSLRFIHQNKDTKFPCIFRAASHTGKPASDAKQFYVPRCKTSLHRR
jgi:hypothetical protein